MPSIWNQEESRVVHSVFLPKDCCTHSNTHPCLLVSDLEKRLYIMSGLGADRMVAGRDH